MAKVMKADASAGNAWAQFLLSGSAEVWVTFDLGIPADALAFWTDPGSGHYGDALWMGPGLAKYVISLRDAATYGDTWIGFAAAAGSTPAPVAGWNPTIEAHYSRGLLDEFFIGGVPVWSIIPAADYGNINFFTAGIVDDAGDDPLQVLYIRNFKAGTTRGGSDLFADDFSSGDLSAWDSTNGDVSVVGDPFPNIAPPTQLFGGSRFYEAPPWRFIVTDLESNTLTFLDHLGLDRSVTITRAASRVISVRVPSDSPEVNIPAVVDGEPFVNEGTRLIYAFRREAPLGGSNDPPWVIRAAGVVLQTDDDADSDHATTTVTAYDPWKYLYRRPILTAGVVIGDTSYPAGTRANEIIIDQLNLANITGPLFFDWGQTAFYTGTIEACDPLPNDGDGFAMTFRSGQTLGEMLDILVATGTCDVVFDPIYDPLNRPGMVCQMSIYQRAGSFRANAVMGWDRWPRSVVQLSRQVLGTERANVMQMYAGQGGPPVPQEIDSASITKFGQYWATQYLPGVPSLAGAHTIAQRQLALLKDGLYTYSLSPAAERAPLLFEEYREADDVPLYASQRFRAPIDGVALRIESIPIVIGDDQLERVNQMLVSFAPESAS